VGSLNISWSLADISLVPVNFTITALNLNSSGESVNSTTQDLFQVLSSPNNATSCDVYQFQVTAVNPAGANSSGFIFASFPSLPTPVTEDAVQTFLMKSANETVSLQILINVSTIITGKSLYYLGDHGIILSFQNESQCPDFSYTLTVCLVGSVEKRTIQVNITDPEVSTNITVDGLRENSRYRYQILASNQFGSSSPSTAVEIGEINPHQG
jgi:hypothetical protein